MSKQLIKDLEALTHANIITPEVAGRIRDYYQRRQDEAPNKLTIILAVLGSLLVGGGVLLVIAHNWDELSRLPRTVIAFIPLIAAQILGVYALMKRRDSAAWREGAAIALFFASGATISLISQIYQVSGSLSGFLLVWTILGLPLIYIFSSSMVSLLCMASATWFVLLVGYAGFHPRIPYEYVLILLGILPHSIMAFRRNAESNFILFMQWALTISVTVTLGAFTALPNSWNHWGPILYCTLFCLFAATGRTEFFKDKSLFKNPWLCIGVPGMLFLLFMRSFRWSNTGLYRTDAIFFLDPLPYLLIVMVGLTIYLIARDLSRSKKMPYPELFSFLILFFALLPPDSGQPFSQLLVNAWLLAICCFYILKGVGENSLPVMNFGLIVLAILAVCRFFDNDIPFIWRSLFFVTVGVGFFLANILVIRKRKAIKN